MCHTKSMQNNKNNKACSRNLTRILPRGPAQSGVTQHTSRHYHRDQGTKTVETDKVMSLPSTFGSFGDCEVLNLRLQLSEVFPVTGRSRACLQYIKHFFKRAFLPKKIGGISYKLGSQIRGREANRKPSSQNLLRIPNYQNVLTDSSFEVCSPRYD